MKDWGFEMNVIIEKKSVILQPQLQTTSEMDVPKDDVNSQFTFTYDDIKGTVHVIDHQTGEEYDLLKEDTGWYDPDYEFSV